MCATFTIVFSNAAIIKKDLFINLQRFSQLLYSFALTTIILFQYNHKQTLLNIKSLDITALKPIRKKGEVKKRFKRD